MNVAPLISIVIPSYNQGQYIEQTICSIINQSYKNVEIIIIDGGSTDDTVAVIKKYEAAISYWVSEPDQGQAHAINKGLQIAKGTIFNWLNSDDYLHEGALQHIADAFMQQPHTQVVCGFTRCFYDDDDSTSHEYQMGTQKTVAQTITHVAMNQPGSFYAMSVVKGFGGVNESLRYVFDDELWFRFLCKYGLKNVRFIDARICHFRLHKSSKSVGEGFDLFAKEIQSLYISIATATAMPAPILTLMQQVPHASTYQQSTAWDVTSLEIPLYHAHFAKQYVNTLYLNGQKKAAKQAMQMVINNGLFTWERMYVSLQLKLLFH